MTWRFVDAASAGLSHRAADAPCQDRSACRVFACRDGADVLVAVISDGAGSAVSAERGAQLVCDTLLEIAGAAVRESSDLDRLGDELIRSWFLDARERLRGLARLDGVAIRDYAATALLAIASDHQTVCARIGDGGIVVRRSPDAPFEVALWPDGGEYANETFFVTDDAAAERIALARLDGVFDVIVFSDGLQQLALERASRRAFAPFFGPLVAAVRGDARDSRQLHADLAAFLDSPGVNERTDDDKSLVVGCRMP